ncbi:hypothetical protein WA026_010666 [Henosepilachna vigintioctopunctata]|uniref:SUN domain-containing protein n=1 Tax=Henosepilachna vigintioctopunctata TaxID=420089 RepID=A0AAW1UYV5_9CUCU
MKSNSVDTKIKKALDKYDADKLAVYDYAAEYAGAEIISTPETIPYPTYKILQIFGLFRLFYSSSPTEIIKPSTMPGNCFQFYGSKARIIIKLGKKINIASVSMEHSPLVQNISDAPREFKVFGLNDAKTEKTLLGTFTYNNEGEAIQNFPLNNPLFWNTEFEYIELEILNNYGNPLYTSIYRFRVHARKKDE